MVTRIPLDEFLRWCTFNSSAAQDGHNDEVDHTMLTATSETAVALRQAAVERAAQSTQKGIKGWMVGRSDTFRVNPFDIDVVQGFNLRSFAEDASGEVDEDDMHLSEDIARRGVRKVLKVRLDKNDNRLKLVDGERRLRATIRAINLGLPGSENLTDVPVVMVPAGKSDLDLIAEQFAENTDDLRKDFTEVDAAKGIQAFVDHEWDEHKIVAKTGLKLARVRRLLAILELPAAVAALVKDKKVSATFALEVVRDSASTEAAVETLNKGLEESAKTGGTKVMKKHVERSKAALPGRPTPRTQLKGLAEDLKTADRSVNEDGTVAFTLSPEAAARLDAILAAL